MKTLALLITTLLFTATVHAQDQENHSNQNPSYVISPDFIVVDYDQGVVQGAYVPDGPWCADVESLATLLQSAVGNLQTARIISVLNESAAVIANAEQVTAQLDGHADAWGVVLLDISTNHVTVTNAYSCSSEIPASQECWYMARALSQADGLSRDEANGAVLGMILDSTGFIKIQQVVYLETNWGTIHTVKGWESFQEALDTIDNSGEVIDTLIIKGHGGEGQLPNADTIELGKDCMLSVTESPVTGMEIWITPHDPLVNGGAGLNVTEQMNELTNGHTKISLRGCCTNRLARRLNNALGGDPAVTGYVDWIPGLPWTLWVMGPSYTW